MTKARERGARPRAPAGIAVDRDDVVRLAGSMKVWELAQLAGTTVDAVVSQVVSAGKPPELPGLGGHHNLAMRGGDAKARIVPTVEVAPELLPAPEVGRLVGRATLREIRNIVDQWVLGRVFVACEWNVTHAARRLGVTRRILRERWAVVRGPEVAASMARLATSDPGADVPAGPSVPELLERGAKYREIHRVVDRWVIARTLADNGGNVTHSAESLGIARRSIRGVRGSGAGGS